MQEADAGSGRRMRDFKVVSENTIRVPLRPHVAFYPRNVCSSNLSSIRLGCFVKIVKPYRILVAEAKRAVNFGVL